MMIVVVAASDCGGSQHPPTIVLSEPIYQEDLKIRIAALTSVFVVVTCSFNFKLAISLDTRCLWILIA